MPFHLLNYTLSLHWKLKYGSLIDIFVLGCIGVLLAVQLYSHSSFLPLFTSILSLLQSQGADNGLPEGWSPGVDCLDNVSRH